MVRGFTLIELSIVLIIIGLLVGGVLAGRDLIRQAELRGINQQLNEFKTVVNTFQLKYDALPGDMDNATSYFSGTANGNGDYTLGNGSSEQLRFWQHLSLSSIIDGNYTGVAGSGGPLDYVAGENAPAGTIASTAWAARALGKNYVGGSEIFAADYGNNQFDFGGVGPDNTFVGIGDAGRVLTPQETYNLDLKLDDGLPAQGRVIARHHATCTDAEDEDDSDATYDLSVTTVSCSLMFPDAF